MVVVRLPKKRYNLLRYLQQHWHMPDCNRSCHTSKFFSAMFLLLILTIHQTRFKTPSAVLETGSNQSCFTFPLRKSKRHKVGNDCHCPLFEFFWLKLQLTSSLKNWEIWDILNKNSSRTVTMAQTCWVLSGPGASWGTCSLTPVMGGLVSLYYIITVLVLYVMFGWEYGRA